ncbi:major facilitator superfamily domain-containing protein [Aspergillus karnatakaensis]|uniref:major facilitator superfamily domain-containing protein n=1 Tax=Aspergillus karnatakaensis TaxID=1810916 RepID=UPI003CCCF1E0
MEKEREVDVENIEKVEQAGAATAVARRPGYTASTPEEERLDKRVNLKIDLIVVPLLATAFLLQGIDKGNIGNAATSPTFVSDTNIKETDVSNSVSLFSATYVPFMPVSVALGRLIGPSRWIPILLLAWGAVTTAQCAMNSRADLYGLRLLLGICEAGFLPTAFYYVGTLYPAYMAGLRMGFVSTSFTFSGAFSALIAYGILQMRSSRWADWQLLFLIEGAITMAVGLLTLLALPSKLSTAWFLTPDERAHASRRMTLDTASVDSATAANTEEMDHRITWANIKTALKDWRKMLIIVWTGCATVPAYGFAIFSPLIVRGMGFDGYRANLMCVPPFMLGAVALLTFVYISDRVRERSLTAAAAMFFSIIGYIALIAAGEGKNNIRYGFLFVIMIGAGSVNPLTAAWLNDNTPDKATRSIVMGLYGWNNVAGVIAGQVYSSKYGPSYRTSVCITLGIVAFGMVGFVATRVSYMLENRRRRKLIEGWTEEEFERERTDGARRGHEKRYFMFGY